MARAYCTVSLKFLIAGLRVEACLMHKSIIHLKTKENLKMLSLLTSLLKALTKPEDGNFLLLYFVIQCPVSNAVTSARDSWHYKRGYKNVAER